MLLVLELLLELPLALLVLPKAKEFRQEPQIVLVPQFALELLLVWEVLSQVIHLCLSHKNLHLLIQCLLDLRNTCQLLLREEI